MKKACFAAIILMAAGGAVLGQTVREGAPQTINTNQTLSASYVVSDADINLQSFDSAVVLITFGNGVAGRTASVKYQWSADDSNWFDEQVLLAGTTNTTEYPFTSFSRRIDLAATNTSFPYIERVRRLAKWFRVAAKADSATTATITVKVIPMNNQN